MLGSHNLLGPTLSSHFQSIVLISFHIFRFGNPADEVFIGNSVNRVLHIGHCILQAVDPVLEVVAAGSAVIAFVAIVGSLGDIAHAAYRSSPSTIIMRNIELRISVIQFCLPNITINLRI